MARAPPGARGLIRPTARRIFLGAVEQEGPGLELAIGEAVVAGSGAFLREGVGPGDRGLQAAEGVGGAAVRAHNRSRRQCRHTARPDAALLELLHALGGVFDLCRRRD